MAQPAINWNTATLKRSGVTGLFETASMYVGFGEAGDVLLDTAEEIQHYDLSGKAYVLTGKVPLSPFIGTRCSKAIAHTKILLQGQQASTTFVCRLTDLETTDAKPYKGQLIGLLPASTLTYRIRKFFGAYNIQLHDPIRSAVILRPPGCRRWRSQLSVCRAAKDNIVVERETRSMDLFNEHGDHIMHEKLDYSPSPYSSVTACSPSQVMVAQRYPPSLHIHQLPECKEIRTFSRRDLKMEQGEHLYAVKFSDRDLLHLAVGDGYGVNALHVYRISHKDITQLEEEVDDSE